MHWQWMAGATLHRSGWPVPQSLRHLLTFVSLWMAGATASLCIGGGWLVPRTQWIMLSAQEN